MKYRILLIFIVLFSSISNTLAQNSDSVMAMRIQSADLIANDSVAIQQTKELLAEYQLSPRNEFSAKINLIYRLAIANRFEESLKLGYENLDTARRKKNDSAECVYLKLIASTYYFMERKKEAIALFKDALIIAEKKGYKKLVYNIKSNIGGVLMDLNDLENAENYLTQSLQIMKQESIPSNEKFVTLRLLASLYYKKGQKKESEILFTNLINESLAEKDSLSASYLWTFYAELLFEKKEVNKAVEMSYKALDILRKQNDEKDLITNLNMLRKYLISANRVSEILAIDSEVIRLQKSVFTTDLNKEISETEVKYKTAEIAYQKKLSELKLKKKQQLYSISLIGIVLIGSIISFSIVKYRNAQQKATLQKERVASIITGEEKERIRIAGELHDGVGQMIVAAKMNLSSLESEIQFENKTQKERYNNIIQMVNDSSNELRNISHNMAPYAILKLGLAKAVKSFLQQIDSKIITVNLFIEGLEDKSNNFHTESVLYRVIQECVNNVLKHAKASKLDISIIKENDEISVTIEDNGKGFDPNKLKAISGIGLLNIRNRIEYLNGTIEWDTQENAGTLVVIHIPLETTT